MRVGGLDVAPADRSASRGCCSLALDRLAGRRAAIALARRRAAGSRRRGAAPLIALAAALGAFPLPHAGRAADAAISARDLDVGALDTRLAYVVTGDAEVDETSRLGLAALDARAVGTAPRPTLAEPIALDPARDELAFYPLIYWPIVAGRPQPPAGAVARIAAYMKNGGTVIFDTRDALDLAPRRRADAAKALWLRTLLAGVDVPELEPVPRDHVVTKTFYLLDGFVGRTDIGQTWIEALPPPDPNDRAPRPARAGDSVSPIIITSNDLAGAWAVDARGTSAASARSRRRRASARWRCAAASIS